MALYECVFLARQDISPQQVEALTDEVAGVITQGGGTVSKKEFWGLRQIAYRVRKNRKAHYVLMNIDASSAAVREMERQMSINEDVLRVLTLRVDELEEGPSAMMPSRNRDERPRREDRGGLRDRRAEGAEA